MWGVVFFLVAIILLIITWSNIMAAVIIIFVIWTPILYYCQSKSNKAALLALLGLFLTQMAAVGIWILIDQLKFNGYI